MSSPVPLPYPGLYNSSYVPEPLELKFAENPGGYLTPYFIGVVLSFLVAGVLLSQANNYWRSSLLSQDPLGLRMHVATVQFLTCLKVVQVGAVGIMHFSVHYGNYSRLTHKHWIFRISVLSATIVSATVQVFFINRVWKFSERSWVFLGPTVVTWLGSIATAIWVTVIFPEDWAKRNHSFVVAGRIAPAFTLTCDLLVTGFTIYYLFKSRHTFPEESPLWRIIRITLESATLPCITALLNVAFDDQAAGGFVFLFVALTPLLQTFSMLYALNSRVYFRERRAQKNLRLQFASSSAIAVNVTPSPSSMGRNGSPLPPEKNVYSSSPLGRYEQLPVVDLDIERGYWPGRENPSPSVSTPSPRSVGTPQMASTSHLPLVAASRSAFVPPRR